MATFCTCEGNTSRHLSTIYILTGCSAITCHQPNRWWVTVSGLTLKNWARTFIYALARSFYRMLQILEFNGSVEETQQMCSNLIAV